MNGLSAGFARIDQAVVDLAGRHAISLLRIALAIIYIWFGALKIAGASPVAALVEKMAYGMPKAPFVRFVGVWEVVVGWPQPKDRRPPPFLTYLAKESCPNCQGDIRA